jgi:site-specific DNA recombinase
MKGAILYIRVSTPEQAAGNYSLVTQEAKERNLCREKGLAVLKLFTDEDSARTDDRPEFKRMMAYCRQHRKDISHVIVSDLSRLARNVLDQGNTSVELSGMGIQLISVDEPNLDESAAGKLLKNVLGSMNQFFSDSLSEKTKFRMKAGVEKGRWLWVAPLGYKNDTDTKTVVIDSEAAPYVQKAFNLVVDTSKSVDGILRLLTNLGFKTRKGHSVSEQTFARLLRNEFYAGWVVSGETRVKGNHEPLISQELFDRVQERLDGKTNGSVPHKRVNEDFPLKGFIRCCSCNKNLTAGWSKGRNDKKLAYYWCWNKDCKNRVTVPRDTAEFKPCMCGRRA